MTGPRVWLGGEGPTELGGLAGHPSYHDPNDHGVLQTLVLTLNPNAEICGATVWSKIHKYASGAARASSRARQEPVESLAVRRLCLTAEEAGADVVVFARDRDAFAERDEQIEAGMLAVRAEARVRVGGGMAVRAIEAWTLLVLGDARGEHYADPKTILDAKHGKSCAHQCRALSADDALARVPKDSHFHEWLESVRAALGG